MRGFNDFSIDMSNLLHKYKESIPMLMNNIGSSVKRDIDNNFVRGGTNTDNAFLRWPVSRAAYGRIRRGYITRTTLIDSGRLRRSIDYEYKGSNVKIGLNIANAPYARDHQEGIGQIRRQFLYLRQSTVYKQLKDFENSFK